MATIKSGSESLKKAIAWISEQRKANPEKDVAKIAQEANVQFDLNPEDSEFVLRFVKDPDA
ncbi:MAG: hypothetical protein KAJ62_01900 [Desulfobacteraceae bacterium]|nr:hypothetical protein [Desulfobacteraceae bacterium]